MTAKHPKLSRLQVAEIKGALGKLTHPELARRYGVSRWLIDDISRGRIWQDVEAAPATTPVEEQ